MATRVNLEWYWIDLFASDTRSKVGDKLHEMGMEARNLGRSVYVLRIGKKYTIQYPKGPSPTLYIGEGRLHQRIDVHRKWLIALKNQISDITFELGVATPRVPNNVEAYKESEAALIQYFIKKYGSLPLHNTQVEVQKFGYIYQAKELSEAVSLGKGIKWRWAIQPMTANPLYRTYRRTHQE